MKDTCGKCKFWRFKASDEHSAVGICDHPNWKVTMMNPELMNRFFVPDMRNVVEIVKSIRTDETFGCNQFEKSPMVVGEGMICPATGSHCDDECCTVGAECNLSDNDLIATAP